MAETKRLNGVKPGWLAENTELDYVNGVIQRAPAPAAYEQAGGLHTRETETLTIQAIQARALLRIAAALEELARKG